MANPDPLATLVHRINNLLAVIHTQSELAQTRGTHEAAQAALQSIRRAADATEQTVLEVRRAQTPGGIVGGGAPGGAAHDAHG